MTAHEASTEAPAATFVSVVEKWGPVPADLCEAFGVNPDGTIADGGLTEQGRAAERGLSSLAALFETFASAGVSLPPLPNGWVQSGVGPDGITAPGDDDAEHVGVTGERMIEIMRNERRATALKITAESMPGGVIPAKVCGDYGLNPDGSIAAGGLTDEGREFADTCVEAVAEAIKDVKRIRGERDGGKADGRRRGPAAVGLDGPDLRQVLDALEMRGPLRAAVRAGAQALAAALNDGGADDEGLTPHRRDAHRHDEDGDCTRTVELGAEPFVLLRVSRIPGSQLGGISVVIGGGAMYASDPNAAAHAVITAEKMLALAAEGVKRNADKFVKSGTVPTGDALIDDMREMLGNSDFDLALVEVDEAGNIVPVDVAADVEAGLAEADAEARMRQAGPEASGSGASPEASGSGASPEASGSGPSTEDPAPPNLPRPSEGAPGDGSGSDDGWDTRPAPSPGDDGRGSTSGASDAGSSGESPGCAGGE